MSRGSGTLLEAQVLAEGWRVEYRTRSGRPSCRTFRKEPSLPVTGVRWTKVGGAVMLVVNGRR
jgi:hypothetical protein